MQRLLLCWLLLLPIYAAKFTGFVVLAAVDTFTGRVQRILLEPGKTLFDDQKIFKIKTVDIEADEESSDVAWVDLVIHYQASKTDAPICVQTGKLSTNQIYRLSQDERYLIGFYILPCVDEEAYLN